MVYSSVYLIMYLYYFINILTGGQDLLNISLFLWLHRQMNESRRSLN